MRALVLLGEDINQPNERGQTPLMYASIWVSANVVRWLWSHQDINKNIVDNRDLSALTHCCKVFYYRVLGMHKAELFIDICRIFLEDDSWLNFDLPDVEGRTALSHAVSSNKLELVEMLLNKEADPNSRDNLGRTPLSYAVGLGTSGMTEKLLARPGVDRDAKDNQGLTPLRRTLLYPRVVSMLLETGEVDVNSKADDGLTPLTAAAKLLKEKTFSISTIRDIKSTIARLERYNRYGRSWKDKFSNS